MEELYLFVTFHLRFHPKKSGNTENPELPSTKDPFCLFLNVLKVKISYSSELRHFYQRYKSKYQIKNLLC